MIKLKISKMENLTIKITISDNEKEIKVSNINVDDYQKTKDLHGISLVDEIVSELLSTIEADK
jgi:hypothetical protein